VAFANHWSVTNPGTGGRMPSVLST
jgi:hypothetical protein